MLTPAGPFPKSKTHLVPEGARVHHAKDAIQIIGRDDKVIHSSPISDITSSIDSIQCGWDAYTSWQNDTTVNPEITYLSTTWAVPEAPSNYNGQSVYLFNGLEYETDVGSAILQPVLQYGLSDAGGGEYWAIGSWYIVNTDLAFHSSLVPVKSGTELVGVMAMTEHVYDDTGTTYYHWNSKFSGHPLNELNITTTTNFDFANITLETYNCTDASYLPTGTTEMKSINLKTGSENPTLKWGPYSDDADNISIAVTTDGSVEGEVVITYPS